MDIPCEYIFTVPHKLGIERLEKCLDLTENPGVRKDSLSSENVAKKKVEKGKQQQKCLQRIRNLDDKWQ